MRGEDDGQPEDDEHHPRGQPVHRLVGVQPTGEVEMAPSGTWCVSPMRRASSGRWWPATSTAGSSSSWSSSSYARSSTSACAHGTRWRPRRWFTRWAGWRRACSMEGLSTPPKGRPPGIQRQTPATTGPTPPTPPATRWWSPTASTWSASWARRRAPRSDRALLRRRRARPRQRITLHGSRARSPSPNGCSTSWSRSSAPARASRRRPSSGCSHAPRGDDRAAGRRAEPEHPQQPGPLDPPEDAEPGSATSTPSTSTRSPSASARRAPARPPCRGRRRRRCSRRTSTGSSSPARRRAGEASVPARHAHRGRSTPVPASALRRVARHGGPETILNLLVRAPSRSRCWRSCGAGPQRLVHHPRRGAEHHARADEDVPDPARVRLRNRGDRRRDPDRPPSGQKSGLRAVEEILDEIDDISFNRLTSHDVVRHKLVGRIVAATTSTTRAVRVKRPPVVSWREATMSIEILNESGRDLDESGWRG